MLSILILFPLERMQYALKQTTREYLHQRRRRGQFHENIFTFANCILAVVLVALVHILQL